MDKTAVLAKLMEIKKLKRELEELSCELRIGSIEEDKIYIAITAYHSILSNYLKDKID